MSYPATHTRCRKDALKMIEKARYQLYLLSVIDCPESGVPPLKLKIERLYRGLDRLRHNLNGSRTSAPATL